ncbi:MAG: GMC family oxidoreductase [Thermomicrobiales bacterium]
MATRQANVVIVGLGASGAILARELTAAGLTVLAIEKGPDYAPEDFWLKFDELRYSIRCGISPTMDVDPITWRPDAETEAELLPWAVGPGAGNPLFLPPSLGVGGGSIHYACWHWRQMEEDFRMRSVIIEHFGEKALPEGSRIVDWPVTYAELEPYYAKLEREIGVSGKAGNINGEIQPGGNPYEAPRSGEFPFPPIRPSASNQPFVDACNELGYHPFPVPVSIISEDSGERKACTYCGFCRDYGCHVGAKSSTQDALVPLARATGNLEILANCRVQKVNVDADGRTRSVSYIDASGERHEAQGDLVVLSAYSLENVRLLLASNINANGAVGKWYTIHNYHWFSGILPEDTAIYAGPAAGGWGIDDFNTTFHEYSDGSFLMGTPIMYFAGDTQPIEGVKNMPPGTPMWGKAFKEYLRSNYRRRFGMYSQIATLPVESNFLDLDPTHTDPWGQPALRITHSWGPHDMAAGRWINDIKHKIAREMGAVDVWEAPLDPPYHVTTHEHGGTVMGDDPSDSVVSSYGQSHESPNLFVIGGGTFPTLSAYNPTATLQALAYRTADYITREIKPGGSLAGTISRQTTTV